MTSRINRLGRLHTLLVAIAGREGVVRALQEEDDDLFGQFVQALLEEGEEEIAKRVMGLPTADAGVTEAMPREERERHRKAQAEVEAEALLELSMEDLQQEHDRRFGRRATFDISTVGFAEAIERLRNAIASGVPVPEEDPDAEYDLPDGAVPDASQ